MAGPEREIDGAVVRLVPYGEADLIVTFLSAADGRVDAFARSARSSLRRFGGRLELFLDGRARLRIGSGRLPTLVSFDRRAALVGEGLDYARLALASLVAELANAAAQPDHADPRLYAWLVDALALCGGSADHLVEARLAVELGWLGALGALPEVDACGDCGGDLHAGATWLDADDGLRCAACSPYRAVQLDGADTAALAALRGARLGADAPRLSAGGARLLRGRVGGLLADHLSRPPRSAAALDRLMRDAAVAR